VLTVRAHSAASHAKHGWEAVTSAAIAGLSTQRTGVIFMLWGRYAQVRQACLVCQASSISHLLFCDVLTHLLTCSGQGQGD
jgi:uracil DNA glycosylase